MVTLELQQILACPGKGDGEVLACAWTPDNSHILAGYWDGLLRVWDVLAGVQATEIVVSQKPVSTCAATPDGKSWLAGTMEGMLGQYNAHTLAREHWFLAHTRPISALLYSPDGGRLATTSWDRNVILWQVERKYDGRTLGSHQDVVGGGHFSPDGRLLLTWSNDGMVNIWEVASAKLVHQLSGHTDRVTCGTVSPDGRWFLSGGRDRQLKLWDLLSGQEANSVVLSAEVRGCFALLDAESILVIDANGYLVVVKLPSLVVESELHMRLPVQCAELSSSGQRLALGCHQGAIACVEINGLESMPLAITATRSYRQTATVLQRLFGSRQTTTVYQCLCPACRHTFELLGDSHRQPVPCPGCKRTIRVCAVTQAPEPVPV